MNLHNILRCCYPNTSEKEALTYVNELDHNKDYEKIYGESIFIIIKEHISFDKERHDYKETNTKFDNNNNDIANKINFLSQINSKNLTQSIPESTDRSLLTSRSTNNTFRINSTLLFHKCGSKDSKEDSLIINCQKILADDEIKSCPNIIIEEIEGKTLNNKEILINALGAIDGARKQNDSVVYFGIKIFEGETIINDFALNIDESTFNGIKHLFIIYYKRDIRKFFIRSMKEKNIEAFPIILVKMNKELILRSKSVIKIDCYYFQLSPLFDRIEVSVMEIKEKTKLEKKKYIFKICQIPITIGRSKLCSIPFLGEKSLSRIHCTIMHDNKNWVLKDGYEIPSTNGVWILAQHSYELQNETLFRVHNSAFRVIMN